MNGEPRPVGGIHVDLEAHAVAPYDEIDHAAPHGKPLLIADQKHAVPSERPGESARISRFRGADEEDLAPPGVRAAPQAPHRGGTAVDRPARDGVDPAAEGVVAEDAKSKRSRGTAKTFSGQRMNLAKLKRKAAFT